MERLAELTVFKCKDRDRIKLFMHMRDSKTGEIIGKNIIKRKPDCFGLWLDTCLYGHEQCRKCDFLDMCKEEFKKDCKDVNNQQ